MTPFLAASADLLLISETLRTRTQSSSWPFAIFPRAMPTSMPSSPAIGSNVSNTVAAAEAAVVLFSMWDEQTEIEALREVYYLTDGGSQNWRKLLALGDTLEQELKRKLLWVWPTAENLLACNKLLRQHNIQRVLSIGCGSGLLEWLLAAAAKQSICVHGLEIDRNWWRSKYAVRSFINLKYVEDAPSSVMNTQFLYSCCGSPAQPPCALIFCYFNNRQAFLNYLRIYEGKWLVLIGPQPTLGIHTDPNPMQPNLSAAQWKLRDCLQWAEQNVVALYEKLA